MRLDMNEKLECREGSGIKLFISPESNYGLTEYKPMSKDTRDYKHWVRRAEFCQKMLNEKGYFTVGSPDNKVILRGKRAEAAIKCMTCAAERINNFERYCSKCEYWFKNIPEKEA